ncbi:restriction endonuclease subunit S [Pyxidicoccus sp. 3LFB2]
MTHEKLPTGWAWATLRELADLKGGITKGLRRSNGAKVRSVPYLRVANVQRAFLDLSEVKTIEAKESEIADLLLRPGDILFNEGGDRDKLGRGWIWRGELPECIHQNHVFRARLRSTDLQPKLVSWYANFVGAAYFSDQGKQTTNLASINLTKLGEFPVPVPPVEEQGRIVAEVEKQFTRLDAGVASLKRVQAQLKRYRASVLKAACEGRLVPTEAELARCEKRDYEPADNLLARILQERKKSWVVQQLARMRAEGKPSVGEGWKKNYEDPSGVSSQGLPNLPNGWCWASLTQLGELGRGRSKHRPRDDPRLYGGPYPFIQTGDVRKSEGTITGYTQTYSEMGLTQSRLWPAETLCITIAGNIAETGILAFDACFPDSVVGFCANSGISTRFVEFFLRTAKGELARFAPATAQKNINLEVLERIAVPLPPLAEQLRIVAEVERVLSVVGTVEQEVESHLARANRLRASILKQAFDGRLVPPDPSDESASSLLQRIRANQHTPEPLRAAGSEVASKRRISRRVTV